MKMNDVIDEAGVFTQLKKGIQGAVKGAKAGYQQGVKQAKAQGPVVPKGTNVVGLDNNTYVWHGAQWINSKTGRVASRDVAPHLTAVAQRQGQGGIMKGLGMVAKGVGSGIAKGASALGKGAKSVGSTVGQAYKGTVTGMKRGQDEYEKSLIGKLQQKVAPTPNDGLPGFVHGQMTGGEKVRRWEQEIEKHRAVQKAQKAAKKAAS